MINQKNKTGHVFCHKCAMPNSIEINDDDDYRYILCKKCNTLMVIDFIHDYMPTQKYIDSCHRLNKEEIDLLIDIALDTRDRRWFNMLVKRKNKMEEYNKKWWEGTV